MNPDMLSTALEYHQAGEFAKAEAMYQTILRNDPRCAAAFHLLGLVYLQNGLLGPAIEHISEAVNLEGGNALFYGNLGVAYKQKGEACSQMAKRALIEDVDAAGNEEAARQCFSMAMRHLDKAIELKADFTDALYNRAMLSKQQGWLAAAFKDLERISKIRSDAFDAWNEIGLILLEQGKLTEARNAFLKGSASGEYGHKAYSNYLLALNYDYEDGVGLRAAHCEWERRYAAGKASCPVRNSGDADKRLKIGYVSPDFRCHSVAYFADALISGHDRHTFEVFCYSDMVIDDTMQLHLKQQSDHWRDISNTSDAETLSMIRQDGIDILVDLAGHTADNRLPLFAARAAPVQVSYLGYPNTTGLSAMDYRITDAWADPVEYDVYYTEKLLRLAHGFLCYTPPALEAAAISKYEAGRPVTFGCFNVLAKISDACIRVWSELLMQIPNSMLLLKNRALLEPEACHHLRSRFREYGIDDERLELLGWVATKEQHFALYHRIDVALDTFPYCGTTTTCEALWMGVPVVTLAGNAHAGRVGVSLLSRLGMHDCIAETDQAYIDIAARMGLTRPESTEGRLALREQVEQCLCSRQQIVSQVEEVFLRIWANLCNSG